MHVHKPHISSPIESEDYKIYMGEALGSRYTWEKDSHCAMNPFTNAHHPHKQQKQQLLIPRLRGISKRLSLNVYVASKPKQTSLLQISPF